MPSDLLGIEIVSATKMAETQFWSDSPLGVSLQRFGFDKRLRPQIAFSNSRGLPEIYNGRILADNDASILVFVHDDVWLDDIFFGNRIVESMEYFDVIGVVGNKRRVECQPNWAFADFRFLWDLDHISGALAHGEHPFGTVASFGASPARCELIDGVFMAANKASLRARQVLFDLDFPFHFYDMDFCRTVCERGLRLGTWPISLTHQSGGGFSREWLQTYRAYLEKWGEPTDVLAEYERFEASREGPPK